jgi:hypothetical protein
MSPDFAGGGTPPVLFGLAGADGGLGTSPLRAVLDRDTLSALGSALAVPILAYPVLHASPGVAETSRAWVPRL